MSRLAGQWLGGSREAAGPRVPGQAAGRGFPVGGPQFPGESTKNGDPPPLVWVWHQASSDPQSPSINVGAMAPGHAWCYSLCLELMYLDRTFQCDEILRAAQTTGPGTKRPPGEHTSGDRPSRWEVGNDLNVSPVGTVSGNDVSAACDTAQVTFYTGSGPRCHYT